MHFDLKNTEPTYQRLVNWMFSQQIGKTMKVYVDDMLAESVQAKDHLTHLEEMFDILQMCGMKLNPNKCAFGVSLGKFLDLMVN